MNTLQALETFLGKLSTAGDRKELRKCLLDQFNGMSGLAREVKIEYDACDSGSMGKNRLLTAVLGVVGDKDDIDDPLPDMSTEELTNAAEELLTHVTRTAAAEPGVSGGAGPEPDAAQETA